MTQQLLAFARRGVLQSKTVDLNAVIAAMADFLRRTLGDTITLEFAREPGLWLCHIDPVQFEAAILNLTINARDAMPEGGTLKVRLANVDTQKRHRDIDISPGRYACVSIEDNGTGMTAEVFERAFEPFFTTKNVGEGSGLGLSQVYGFVNQSGGDVKIASAPGKGTTVALYLPRYDGGVRDQKDDVDDAAASDFLGTETILVVEDEPSVREVAVEMIQDLGYKVLAAADGVEALELLHGRERIDLLFSDVLMPGGLSGVILAAKARQIRFGLKVLLTSGYPARDGARVSPAQFPMIQKPYQRDKLASMLRSVLDLHGQRSP
jgi:CheY-like chemotaxis protein